MTTAKRITTAADTVGAALSTSGFRERFAEAKPDAGYEVEALARAELIRRGVDLTGLEMAFRWDPSRRKLTITIDRARPPTTGNAGTSKPAPRSR